MNQSLPSDAVVGVVEISLSAGKVAIVDESDLHKVSGRIWHAANGGNTQYAVSSSKEVGQGHLHMHRVIVDAPNGFVVDHINGNGLDNRRSNLRVCTHQQNIRNQQAQIGRSSKFKGVYRDRNKWRVSIKVGGETIHLGGFANEVQAAKQYDRAARLFFGKFARTNEMLGLF